MAVTGKHQAHERLAAEIRLSQQRLERFVERSNEMAEDVGADFRERADVLIQRCGALRDRVADWKEVEVGLPTAVSDLGAAVDTLVADAEAATDTEPQTYQETVDRQVRAWQGRVDQLRLQGSLAAMDARDDLESLSQRLDHARGGALVELQNAFGDTKNLVADLREDVEEVLVDVRHAVERAASALTQR